MIPTMPLLLGTSALAATVLLIGKKRAVSSASSASFQPGGGGDPGEENGFDPGGGRPTIEEQMSSEPARPGGVMSVDDDASGLGGIGAVGGWILVRDAWGRTRYVPTPMPGRFGPVTTHQQHPRGFHPLY